MDRKLTLEQQKLATDHMDLALWLADKWSKKQSILDKEELESIALLNLTKAALTYNPSKSSFKTYMSRCISYKIQTEIGKNKKYKNDIPLDKYTCAQEDRTRLQETFAQQNLSQSIDNLKEAIEELEPTAKAILKDFYFNNMYQKDIAEKYGLNQSDVSKILKRARIFLKDYLKK